MADRFPTTRHSLIFAARQPELRTEAMESIVELYWKPVYKYLRLKWGRAHEDAEDLTQDFFAGLAQRDLLNRWQPERASFRTYLRLCLDSHAGNARLAESRLKRGGGVARFVSLDFAEAEREIQDGSPAAAAPEELFHREWQRRLFELGLAELKGLCEATGRDTQWRVFEAYDLARGVRPAYDRLAGRFGVPVTTVTNHLAWARRELRKLVLDRLARTTGSGAELRREARDAFGGGPGRRP